MGNATPLADLMVVSPFSKQMFLIDVKGLHRKNPWILKRKTERQGLFYVLAFVQMGAQTNFLYLARSRRMPMCPASSYVLAVQTITR